MKVPVKTQVKHDQSGNPFPEVDPDKAKQIQIAENGKYYSVYGPPEAMGAYVGFWAKMKANYPDIEGEKKGSIQQAMRHCISEKKGIGIQDVRVRVAV